VTQLAVREERQFTTDQIDLIRRTVAKDASDEELALFLYTANSRGLDPLLRQIHAVSRFDKRLNRNVMTIQTGIDGYRLIAERTGAYAGNDDPEFEYTANANADSLPTSATVTVYKIVQGMRCPFTARARWSEYFPGEGAGAFMWKRMPHTMLGKCAESLALRKAFPAEMGGLFVHEEMDQAGGQVVSVVDASPAPVALTKPKMVTSVEHRLYKRYAQLVAEAAQFQIDVDGLELPITEERLTELALQLKEKMADAQAKHLEEVGAF
jgi:phage recombination protein Bet